MKAPKSIMFKLLPQCLLSMALLASHIGARAAGHGTGTEYTTFGAHVYVPVEYCSIDAGNLNKYMGVAELPQVRVPAVFLGLGTQIQMERIVLNVSFATAGKRYKLENARLSAPFSTYGFTIGYDLQSSPYINMQPYAGFRMARVGYKYENLTPQPGVPTGSPDAMEFRGRRGMLDLGLGISLQSKFLAGLRGGVLLPVGQSRWKSGDGAQLSGGPELSYRYYIGLNFGFGRADIRVKSSPVAKSADPDGNILVVY